MATVTTLAWMSAFAAAAGLLLAALAISRAAKSPISVPLALSAAIQFAWNAANVFLFLTSEVSWRWLGTIVAPLLPPAAFWFVLIFVGRARTLRRTLQAVWLIFGLQSVAGAVLLFAPSLGPAEPFGLLSVVDLAFILPLLTFAVVLIVGHVRRTSDPAERSRARLLIVALVVVVAFGAPNLLADAGIGSSVFVGGRNTTLQLAAVGSFAFNALLFVITNRLGVYADSSRGAGAIATVLTMLLALVGYLGVFAFARGSNGLLIIGLATVTLALVAFGRYALASWATEREGLERLAMFGRFSAQMAHDLKNPLAAAYGAAQVMEEDDRQGRPVNSTMLREIKDGLSRLGALIDRYQKLGKLELSPQPLDLNALVQKVLALRQLAPTAGVTLCTELASTSTAATADVELLTSVLENLVKNALEAMPKGGTITVRTRPHPSPEGLELEVEDTGEGMSARQLEQAGQLFATTKAQGSGLGLYFVREVARAHGGDVAIWSQQGKGTRVTFWFPREPGRRSA